MVGMWRRGGRSVWGRGIWWGRSVDQSFFFGDEVGVENAVLGSFLFSITAIGW